MWTCHSTFCLGPFFEKLGLKSIEQKKVLNEGVMACIFSINTEITFLVALARRASTKISEDLAECVKVDIFFALFFPSIPPLEKLVQVFDEHFPNKKSSGPNFFLAKFSVFWGKRQTKTRENSRLHLEYPQGLVRHSCKLCGFHLCESSLWQQGM